MAANPLDNPIWTALTTRQAHFAETNTLARKFPGEVSPLSAFETPTAEAYASLSKLVPDGGIAVIFIDGGADQAAVEAAGCEILDQCGLLQMIHEGGGLDAQQTEFAELTAEDAPEMLALAKMTKPGPFGLRTRELGTYLGIRVEGHLAAMAGERLHLPGYTEISAVCTHPNHVGRGYARTLMAELIRQILRRNEIPILHVRAENARAIELYRRLGFADRHLSRFAVIRKSAARIE